MELSRILFVALSTMIVAGAHAQTIDQNQPDHFFDMADFSQTDLAQSFTQTASNIDGAGFYTATTGSGGNMTVSLFDQLPNNGGSLLASGTYANAQAGQWVDVFWNDVHITSGATYYLVFTSTNAAMGISGSIFNPYPNGESFSNAGYQAFPSDDYAFRTYAATPEPMPFVVLSLGALGLIRRRRK